MSISRSSPRSGPNPPTQGSGLKATRSKPTRQPAASEGAHKLASVHEATKNAVTRSPPKKIVSPCFETRSGLLNNADFSCKCEARQNPQYNNCSAGEAPGSPVTSPPPKKLFEVRFTTRPAVAKYAAIVGNFEARQNPQCNKCTAAESPEPTNVDRETLEPAKTTPPLSSAEDKHLQAAVILFLLAADPNAFTPPPPEPTKPPSKRKPRTREEMDTYNERRKDLRYWKREGILERVLRDEKLGIPGPSRPTQQPSPQHIVPAQSPAEHPRPAVLPAAGSYVVPATAAAGSKSKRAKTEEKKRKEAKAAKDKRLLKKLNIWVSHEDLARLFETDPVEAAARRDLMAEAVRAADEEASSRAELTVLEAERGQKASGAEEGWRLEITSKGKAPVGSKPTGVRKSYDLDPNRIIRGANRKLQSSLKDLHEA